MSKDDGGPAFPVNMPNRASAGTILDTYPGMSLRDKFADSALSGLANENMLIDCMTEGECELRIVNAAALAYRIADAMIEQRTKGD